MILKIPYWTHSGIVFDKCHKKYLPSLRRFTLVETFLRLPQTSPVFIRVCSTSLLKTLLEKEKLFVTSNFSFSHSVSTLLGNFLLFSSSLKLSFANSFSLEASKICRMGMGKCQGKILPQDLLFTKRQNFRSVRF